DLRFHVHGGAASRLRVWSLTTPDGEVVAFGEPHGDMADVRAEICKVQGAPANQYDFVKWKDRAGEWYWLLRAERETQGIAHGGPYRTEAATDASIRLVAAADETTPIVEAPRQRERQWRAG